MAFTRIELLEMRSGAPVDAAEIAVARAGSPAQARRWAAAAQERAFERLAARARAAIARRRATGGEGAAAMASGAASATSGPDLSFYRGLALRYREAASKAEELWRIHTVTRPAARP